MRHVVGWAFGLTCVIGFSVSAVADDNGWTPDAARGRILAERLCATCHVVSDAQTSSATAGPPTFASIANRPGQTRQRIVNVLISPHPPMPDVHITVQEIDDIVSYLDTMRSPSNSEPLLKIQKQPPKIEYPKPS